jgi:hypothetical protein
MSRLPVVLRHFTWVTMVLAVSSGCCHDSYDGNSGLTRLFRAYPVSTFVDSAGQHLQILFTDSSYIALPQSGVENEACSDHVPFTTFTFYPLYQGETGYFAQMNSNLSLLGIKTELSSFETGAFTHSLTIQGFHYNNCMYRESTDSLGVVWQMAVDRYYGIVLLSYRDRYRWERVLEW